MGWFIRKSFSFGPVRFNLSKGGLGYSVGTKGLRFGEDAHGRDYVFGGRYGLYYRHGLGRGQVRWALLIALAAALLGLILS